VANYTYGLLGLAYEAAGATGSAQRAYERALGQSLAMGDRREASYALNRIACLLRGEGRFEEALGHLDRARALSRASRDRVGEALSLYNTATVEDARGHLRIALDRLQDSLEISESLRADVASLHLRSSYIASLRERREREVGLLMRLHVKQPAVGYDRLGFEASEKARARSLLDGLTEARAGIREGVDPTLLEREASIRRSLNAKAERIRRLSRESATASEAAELERELDELTNALRELEAEVRAASPRFAALMQPRPLGLEAVQQQVVDARSVLLQYFVGEHQSFLWVVTPKTLEGHPLPGRQEIEGLVQEMHTSFVRAGSPRPISVRTEGDPTAPAAMAELSRILLSPIEGRFEGKRLLVAPDGALSLVPFAALPAPGFGPELRKPNAWLLDQHEIVYLPSASTVALVRGEWEQKGPRPRSAAVFADPVFEADDPRIARKGRSPPMRQGLPPQGTSPLSRSLPRAESPQRNPRIPRLLETRREARAIAALLPDAKLVLGFEASRETATSPDLAEYRIVHFATHGIIDNDHPELSGVVLSLFDAEGVPQDGFLRLHDIYNLHLPADLVVLSACSTALGRQVTGEGLVGLVRGFMYAGSRRVVASLWDVDDEATSELMRRFYQRMFQDDLAPAAALRAAQLEMSRVRRWSHPRNWAAFILQGEWRSDEAGHASDQAR
jgi:CHAT domain-containing protein